MGKTLYIQERIDGGDVLRNYVSEGQRTSYCCRGTSDECADKSVGNKEYEGDMGMISIAYNNNSQTSTIPTDY